MNTAIIIGIFCIVIFYILKIILGDIEKVEPNDFEKRAKDYRESRYREELHSRMQNYIGYHPKHEDTNKVLMDLVEAIIDDYEKLKMSRDEESHAYAEIYFEGQRKKGLLKDD